MRIAVGEMVPGEQWIEGRLRSVCDSAFHVGIGRCAQESTTHCRSCACSVCCPAALGRAAAHSEDWCWVCGHAHSERTPHPWGPHHLDWGGVLDDHVFADCLPCMPALQGIQQRITGRRWNLCCFETGTIAPKGNRPVGRISSYQIELASHVTSAQTHGVILCHLKR